MARRRALPRWPSTLLGALNQIGRAQVRQATRVVNATVKAALKAPAKARAKPLANKPGATRSPAKRPRKPTATPLQKTLQQSMDSAMRVMGKATKPPRSRGDWRDGLAVGPAGARRFRLLMPPNVKPSERLPLLVMLHGCGQDANTFAASTRMDRLAVSQRFAVLYPEQDRLSNPQGCWNWYDTDSRRAFREAATLLAAIDQVCLLYRVDPSRVAVAGLSAGASMAALLASRHPERFAAVAMHSGIAPGTAHSTASAVRAMQGRASAASPSLPAGKVALPPLLVIQGDADRVVAPANGEGAAVLWAEAAGATARPARVVQRGQRRAMAVVDFTRGRRTLATLCSVHGLGHAWSGGASGQAFSDATGPDASRLVWAFALKQFKAAARRAA